MAVICDRALTHQAVRVWMKVRKLSAPDQGCTLPVSMLAAQLSVSPRTVDTALRTLAERGLLRTVQHVTASGSKAASRWALPPKPAVSGFVDLPIGLVDRLDAPTLRVLAVLVHQGATVGEGTVEAVRLRLGLSAEQARERCTGLVALGLLEVERRAGRGGRNLYRPRLGPLATALASPDAVPEPGVDCALGAGEFCVPDAEESGGNCASGTGRNDVPGAVETCVPYGKTIGEGERAKPCPSRPAEGAPSAPDGRERPGREEHAPPTTARPAAASRAVPSSGVEQSVADWDRLVQQAAARIRGREAPGRRDVATALSGLGPLDAALTGWRRRRVSVLVAEMIDEQRLEPERIATRIRRACDRVYERGEQVRDVYGFLTKMALPTPYGCQDPACEDGMLWPGRTRCRACLERRRDKAADRRKLAQMASQDQRQPDKLRSLQVRV